MVIYIDSLILLNFIMNSLTFIISSKFIKTNTKNKVITFRIVLISLLSSLIYTAFVLSSYLRDFLNMYTVIFFIALNVIYVFRPKNLKIFIQDLVIVHIAMFALGGAIIGGFYYTSIGALIGNAIQPTLNNISLKLFIALTSASYLIIKIITKNIFYLKRIENKTIDVCIEDSKITDKDNKTYLNLLYDTGNDFIDPISGLPVIIIYYKNIEPYIDNALYLLYENKKNVINDAFLLDSEVAKNLKLLPFKSVGCESGLIIGIEKSISFTFDNCNYNKKCVLGIIDFEIDNENNYIGIFNPNLVNI